MHTRADFVTKASVSWMQLLQNLPFYSSSFQEELVDIKSRISLLEGHARTIQKPTGDRLPRFSSAKLERMKSVHSDALSLRLMKQQSNIETSVYRFPKISAMIKKESEEFKTPETKLQNAL